MKCFTCDKFFLSFKSLISPLEAVISNESSIKESNLLLSMEPLYHKVITQLTYLVPCFLEYPLPHESCLLLSLHILLLWLLLFNFLAHLIKIYLEIVKTLFLCRKLRGFLGKNHMLLVYIVLLILLVPSTHYGLLISERSVVAAERRQEFVCIKRVRVFFWSP